MKDIVGLLDSYRLALLDDPNYLAILALLFRNRSASPDELKDETGTSKARVSALIRELYRAGWIRTTARDRLFLRPESEGILEAWGMLDVALDSLVRELVESETDRASFGHWLSDRASRLDKNHCLHTLQAARWTAKVFPETDYTVWRRVLRLVLHEACSVRNDVSLGPVAEHDEAELENSEEVDRRNLRTFWHDFNLPTESRAREVTLQGMFVLIIFWTCYDSDSDVLRDAVRSDAKCLQHLWSEYGETHRDLGGKFTKVLSHCLADFGAPRATFNVDDLISEIRLRLGSAGEKSLDATADDSRDKMLRLLLLSGTKQDR